MKFPVGINKQQKKYLKNIYEETYNSKISLGKIKARNVARARFYEEVFKLFQKREKMLVEQESFSLIKKSYIKEEKDYKIYKAGDSRMVVSTNEKILELKKFRNNYSNGILRDMNDPYELEVFSKIKDENPDIKFSPDMYYVIK